MTLLSNWFFIIMGEVMARQGTVDGMDQEDFHCILQNVLCIRFPCSAGTA